MKFYISDGFVHHKNLEGMIRIINHLGWQRTNFEDSEVVWSPANHLHSENYPGKKFIFGPHFSVFPDHNVRRLSNSANNSIYIQPSQPTVNTWVDEFGVNNLPVVSFPFPVDIPNLSTVEKKRVLIYFKQRNPSELQFVKNVLSSRGIGYDIIEYGQYIENDFQKKLNETRWCFCLGRHESQGFAIQSMMAKNIPLLVWSVKQRSQEFGCSDNYKTVKTEVSTVPYWDKECGEKFYYQEELEDTLNVFLKNLDGYNSRDFIRKNLSLESCADKFLDLINSICK